MLKGSLLAVDHHVLYSTMGQSLGEEPGNDN